MERFIVDDKGEARVEEMTPTQEIVFLESRLADVLRDITIVESEPFNEQTRKLLLHGFNVSKEFLEKRISVWKNAKEMGRYMF